MKFEPVEAQEITAQVYILGALVDLRFYHVPGRALFFHAVDTWEQPDLEDAWFYDMLEPQVLEHARKLAESNIYEMLHMKRGEGTTLEIRQMRAELGWTGTYLGPDHYPFP